MYTALTRLMTGQTPQARSGETPTEREARAPGYATFDNLLTAIGQQTATFSASMADLKDTLQRENAATRSLVDTYRAETNKRLDALEAWRDQEEVADAVRQGRIAMFLLAFRWLTEHWQVVWALVALILGLAWTATGNAPVGVGPVTAPVSPAP